MYLRQAGMWRLRGRAGQQLVRLCFMGGEAAVERCCLSCGRCIRSTGTGGDAGPGCDAAGAGAARYRTGRTTPDQRRYVHLQSMRSGGSDREATLHDTVPGLLARPRRADP